MPEFCENGTTFFRWTTDKRKHETSLRNQFAGPGGSSCWLVGGGPSLKQADIELLNASPAPKMCINLAGAGLIRPTFWTSYDPTSRFLRSVYLDAGVMKFVHRRRAMDIVPETTFKVCECPNLYFFEGDSQRGFNDFLSQSHRTIVDWNDSMVQAIDILYQLGFRTVYLLGCEMRISASEEMIEFARQRNVEYRPEKLLGDFVKECEAKGISKAELASLQSPEQYHFEQQKSFEATISTDFHYFRVAQFMRLSREAISLAGMKLISVTPGSLLNDYFETINQAEASQRILESVGDPGKEQTAGRYTDDRVRLPKLGGMMRDFQPLHWSQKTVEQKVEPPGKKRQVINTKPQPMVDEADIQVERGVAPELLKEELERMKKYPVQIENEG